MFDIKVTELRWRAVDILRKEGRVGFNLVYRKSVTCSAFPSTVIAIIQYFG